MARSRNQLVLVALITAGCGGGGQSGPEVASPPPVAGISLLAGSIGGKGNVDGIGVAARFSSPNAIAVDETGNVYVADSDVHTIRKITPQGLVTTLAGTTGVAGDADGLGIAARFSTPVGVAVDRAGNVYVADSDNHAIRKITPMGMVSTLLRGSVAGYDPMTGSVTQYDPITDSVIAAVFSTPNGVAVDSAGNVYVSQTKLMAKAFLWGSDPIPMPAKVVLKVTPAGLMTTLAGTALAEGALVDGLGEAARFLDPTGLAVDASGNVYVADGGSVRHITPAGLVTTLVDHRAMASSLGASGPCSALAAIAVDRAGAMYAGGLGEVCRIAPSGVVSRLAGKAAPNDDQGLADGAAESAVFGQINGLAVDSVGNVLVADGGAVRIRKIAPSGDVTTIAGATKEIGVLDGLGVQARFDYPGIVAAAVSESGTLFATDAVSLREVTSIGVVTTRARNAEAGISGAAIDTSGTAYQLARVFGRLTCGPLGCRSEPFESAYQVQKLTSNGELTNLGSPIRANPFGPQPAYPRAAMAVDAMGNVYVADHGVSDKFQQGFYYSDAFTTTSDAGAFTTISKITPQGVVSTLAGMAGIQGAADGVGTAASFISPTHLAVDALGNVYVVDGRTVINEFGDVVLRNGRSIRKITPSGVVTTLGRNGAATAAGEYWIDDDIEGRYGAGAAVRFGEIVSLAARGDGEIYVAEQFRTRSASPARIRRITTAGAVTTVAGTRHAHGLSLGGLPGSLSDVRGLAADAKGALYVITDAAVLKIQLPP